MRKSVGILMLFYFEIAVFASRLGADEAEGIYRDRGFSLLFYANLC